MRMWVRSTPVMGACLCVCLLVEEKGEGVRSSTLSVDIWFAYHLVVLRHLRLNMFNVDPRLWRMIATDNTKKTKTTPLAKTAARTAFGDPSPNSCPFGRRPRPCRCPGSLVGVAPSFVWSSSRDVVVSLDLDVSGFVVEGNWDGGTVERSGWPVCLRVGFFVVFVDRVFGAFERSGVVGGTLTVFDLKQRLTAVGSSQAPSRKRKKGFTFSPRFGEYGLPLARFGLCLSVVLRRPFPCLSLVRSPFTAYFDGCSVHFWFNSLPLALWNSLLAQTKFNIKSFASGCSKPDVDNRGP